LKDQPNALLDHNILSAIDLKGSKGQATNLFFEFRD